MQPVIERPSVPDAPLLDGPPHAPRSVRLLPGSVLRTLLTLDVVVPAVEAAYVAHNRGEAVLFPVVREALPGGDAVFGVKSGFWPERAVLGLKVAGYWRANRQRGLDNHQAAVLLLDPATGLARTIMDGNWVTFIRTAAAGAIAARWLARADARQAVIVGTGVQGEAQARALAWLRGEQLEIVAFEPLDGADHAAAERFAERLRADGIRCQAGADLEAAIREADIVATATPSARPLIAREWLPPGVHINAMGADSRGKQEHEIATLRDSRVIVDDWPQAREFGECQHGVAAGLFADGPPATLGAVIEGKSVGRGSDDETTLFDATGIALQDLAVAELAERLSAAADLGTHVELD
jgi:alanine dehydrogenase